jgi:hypothetical protein
MDGATAVLWQYHLADKRPILCQWQPPGKTSNAALVCYMSSETLYRLRMFISCSFVDLRKTGVWVNMISRPSSEKL